MLSKSLAALIVAFTATAGHAAERVVTVFAAASLSITLEEVGKAFTARTRIPVRFSFAASSALARQIESGAPADVFISADQEWMDYLASRKLINPGTRSDIVSNSLVLIAPAGSTISLRIDSGFGLAAALGARGRLATGDPASVPAGRYAKAALTRLGVWKDVEDRLIPADNVRTALNFVALGEAPLGVVYASDAHHNDKVRLVDTFPAWTHGRITYPAAARTGASVEALQFVQFLRSDAAQAVFVRAGVGRP